MKKLDKQIWVGIDPGMNGAVVALGDDGVRYWLARNTYAVLTGQGSKKDYRTRAMAELLRDLRKKGSVICFLEKQGVRPTDAKQVGLSVGRAMGIWEGIIAGLNAVGLEIPLHIVAPQQWAGAICKGYSGKGKERTMLAVERLFPEVSLIPEGCKVRHDGLADALALAEFGRREYIRK